MKSFTHLLKITAIAALIGASGSVWAEAAPVYDVEAFETGNTGSDLPMPPPPNPEGPATMSRNEPSYMQNSTVSTANMGMDQRMRRVEQQVNNMQHSDAFMQVESLQNQVQALRGQVEQLTRQLAKMESSQKAMYDDLDKRMAQAMATAKAAVIAESDVPAARKKHIEKAEADTRKHTIKSASQPDVAEEQKIYQTAYDYIKARKYGDAVNALQKMLQKYPSGQFASNAHYWLGELYGLMGEHEKALQQFTTVLSKFPDSPRVSDAQLKIGLIFAAQSKWASAKTAFRKVINKHPGTASSRLASEQLKQIKKAGH